MHGSSKHQILQEHCGIQGKIQQKVTRSDLFTGDEELQLLTKQEVADLLKVKVSTISAWITRKQLEPTKVGSCTRISYAEVRRVIKRSNSGDSPLNRLSVGEQEKLDKRRARILSSLGVLERSGEFNGVPC